MAVVETFDKQPSEAKDYDLDYSEWLTGYDTDSVLSATVSVTGDDAALVVQDPVVNGNRVKLWVSAGTDGNGYKVEVTTTTAEGRIKEDELMFYVRED